MAGLPSKDSGAVESTSGLGERLHAGDGPGFCEVKLSIPLIYVKHRYQLCFFSLSTFHPKGSWAERLNFKPSREPFKQLGTGQAKLQHQLDQVENIGTRRVQVPGNSWDGMQTKFACVLSVVPVLLFPSMAG